MNKLLSTLIVGSTLSFSFAVVNANPSMPPFYADVMKMTPEGKLGQVIKQEKITTPVKGRRLGRLLIFHRMLLGGQLFPLA